MVDSDILYQETCSRLEKLRTKIEMISTGMRPSPKSDVYNQMLLEERALSDIKISLEAKRR